MITNNERLNVLLLHAAEQVVAAYMRGEFKAATPAHLVPLTMLANRVDEVHRTTVKEDRKQ